MLTHRALLVLAIPAAGCIPSLEPVAAQAFPCGEEQIEVENVGMSRQAKGCGKEDIYIFDGNQGKWVSLRERAAFEFSCDKDDLKVQVLDSMTFGVTGCDHKAVYKTDWMHGFVMNSADERAGGKREKGEKGGGAEGGDDKPADDKPDEGKSL